MFESLGKFWIFLFFFFRRWCLEIIVLFWLWGKGHRAHWCWNVFWSIFVCLWSRRGCHCTLWWLFWCLRIGTCFLTRCGVLRFRLCVSALGQVYLWPDNILNPFLYLFPLLCFDAKSPEVIIHVGDSSSPEDIDFVLDKTAAGVASGRGSIFWLNVFEGECIFW